MPMNFDRANHCRRVMDAAACEFDQIQGSLHRRGQHTKHFIFESAQRRKPRIGRRREVDAGAPDFIERADGGPPHSGKSFDRVELTQARTCQSGLNRLLEPLGIDGLEEPARETRGELPHGQHLHAVRALPGGVDSEQVSRQFGMNDNGVTRSQFHPRPQNTRSIPRPAPRTSRSRDGLFLLKLCSRACDLLPISCFCLPSGRTACGGPKESASNGLLRDNDRYAFGRS